MSKVHALGQYKEIEIQVKKQEVSQEEVEKQMQDIIAQNPTMVEKDGAIENGDIATIDFEGFKDDVAFDGGKAEAFQLTIGSGQFIPGFEEQMIGMKKGESKDLNITFPENYGVEDLNGAAVIFKVLVHKIETKIDAELNDAFIASLQNPEITTVDAFKAKVEENIQAQHEYAYKSNVENAIFDKLIATSEVEVSTEDVEKALDQHMHHVRMDLAQRGMQFEQYLQMTGSDEESFRNQLKTGATQQAKLEAIIDEVIVAEKLATTDEEIDQQIEMIAQQNQITRADVLEKVSIEALKHDYNRVKASQLIIQSAIVSA